MREEKPRAWIVGCSWSEKGTETVGYYPRVRKALTTVRNIITGFMEQRTHPRYDRTR